MVKLTGVDMSVTGNRSRVAEGRRERLPRGGLCEDVVYGTPPFGACIVKMAQSVEGVRVGIE